MKKILLLLFLVSSHLNAQKQYPKNYFGAPVEIPILLSGNFGELRSNHFHAGIDIKTPNGEGEKVLSIADGVVSRIKVSPRGYGKAIYIVHPNGYTSVYAHLQKFSPAIEAYVKKHQYEKKNFEVELFPTASEFKLKKGELIGYIGNTGGSAGPHLHLEIRDSKTQNTINPFLFGYSVEDKIPPQVYRVYGYSLNEQTSINGSQLPQSLIIQKQTDGSFLANKIYAYGKIGFGVQTIDKMNFTNHIYGVYKASILVNGALKLSYTFDEASFTEDNLINTFIDYSIYSNSWSRVQLMYKKPSNKLSIYSVAEDDGMIDIVEGFSYTITIVLEDFHKNTTKIMIPVEGKKQEITEKIPEKVGKMLIASRENYYKTENASVYFSQDTFYEDIFIDISQNGDTIKVKPTDVPLRKNYNLTIDIPTKFVEKEQGLLIALVNPKNKKLSYVGAVRKDKTLSIRTRALGDFIVAQDSIAPKITPINFSSTKNKVAKLQTLQVKIEDDFSGVAKYEATINGKWILMEHDPKTKTLTFDINDIQPVTNESLIFKLQVTDNVGNQNSVEIPLVYE